MSCSEQSCSPLSGHLYFQGCGSLGQRLGPATTEDRLVLFELDPPLALSKSPRREEALSSDLDLLVAIRPLLTDL